MEEDFEGVGKVVEVLVAVGEIEGGRCVVLADMVAEHRWKEEMGLFLSLELWKSKMKVRLTLVAWRKNAKLVSRLWTSSDSTPNRVPFSNCTDKG